MGSSGRHYMPRPDAKFGGWVEHYAPALRAWWLDQGMDPAGLDPLTLAVKAWDEAFLAHLAARAAAEAATAAKDRARGELEEIVRGLTRFVQNHPKMTDPARAELGIALRRVGGPPARTPTTCPVVIVEGAGRLTHVLRFMDESTPTSRARPRGVIGAEVWVNVEAPGEGAGAGVGAGVGAGAGVGGMGRFVALATSAPARVTFGAGEGGRLAVYALRWVSTTGERGPWSRPARGTIAA